MGLLYLKKQNGKAEQKFAVINPNTGSLLYELGEYKYISTGIIMTKLFMFQPMENMEQLNRKEIL